MGVMKETVLYYSPHPTEDVKMAKAVFAIMDIRIKNIGMDQFHQTVGSLAGVKGQAEEGMKTGTVYQEPVQDSIMVFCGFSEERLDYLLMHLSRAGVSREIYKAMLTPSNSSWSFGELYEELKKERSAILEQKKKG